MALLSLFDHLYCQEENLELEEERLLPPPPPPPLPEEAETERQVLSGAEAGEEWAAVLASLAAREGERFCKFVRDDGTGGGGGGDECYIRSGRKVVAEWIAGAASRHGFSALTEMLAVSYLDGCFLPCGAVYGSGLLLRLQDDKPWMGRLAAVACLSLAAKVEETRVPHLIDLQMASPAEACGGYVFEPKTVRRMELLVLSALGWRMNPVTPFSFIHHLLPQLCSKVPTAGAASATGAGIVARIRALVRRCEAALLSVIVDWRWVQYPASIWAAAALLHATASADGGATAAVEAHETRRLISLLEAPKEKVEECLRLLESTNTAMIDRKRKHASSTFHSASSPPSPSGVIGSCFSCESSCDSWATWPPSSPEAAAPPLKRLNGSGVKESFAGDEGVNFVQL